MGMNQKQSVTLLYAISSLLAIAAILFAERQFTGAIIVLVLSFVVGAINWMVIKREHIQYLDEHPELKPEESSVEEHDQNTPQA